MNLSQNLNALIIEDELIFSTKLKHSLEIHDLSVFQSIDVESGIKVLKTEKPSFIFLDNFLPTKGGLDSIELIKNLSPNSSVVLMSSAFDINLVSEAIENKADFLLNKNQDLEKVLPSILEAPVATDKLDKTNDIEFIPSPSDEAPKRIAIVEDEETFSLNLQWILSGLSRNTIIHSFASSADFIESLLNNEQFDFIFADLYFENDTFKDAMPFIHHKIPQSKIIVFSSKAEVNDAIELMTIGIDGFIEKNRNWKINFLNALKKLGLL